MSLLHCPECGHEVSTTAAACPNCARPLNLVPPVPVERKVVVVENPNDRDGFPTWAFIPIGLLSILLLVVMYAIFIRTDDTAANQHTNININASRQTASSAPASRSEPPMTSAPPSTAPPSTTTVPGSQTSVAESPTKGKVSIVAKMTVKNGAPQAVRNEKFYLLDQDVESILSSAGVQPIEGQSLTDSLGLSLVFPDRYGEFNRKAFTAIRKHIKYSGQTDGSGKADLSGVDPNSYYLFGMTKAGHGFTLWNSPVAVQVGDNILNLSPQSLTEITDPAG